MKYIGLHYNYWNGTGAEADFQKAFEYTAATGADAIDFGTMLVVNASAQERDSVRKLAEDYHLRLTLNGGVPGVDLANPDEEVRRAAIVGCKAAIDAAAAVNAPVWTGVIYTRWLDKPTYVFTEEARAAVWNRAVSSCQEIAEHAAQMGVRIGFEICNRFEAYLVTTVAEGIRFTQAIGNPAATILPDIFHMNIEEDYTPDALSMALESGRTSHIHMSEGNRRLPGLKKSDIPWNDIFRIIGQSDYDGSVILEPMVLMGVPAANSFHTWRYMTAAPTVENMIAEAQKSIAFVKRGILG